MDSKVKKNDRHGPAWEAFIRCHEDRRPGYQAKWHEFKAGFRAGLLFGKEVREGDCAGAVPA